MNRATTIAISILIVLMTILSVLSVYVIKTFFPEYASIDSAVCCVSAFFTLYGIVTFITLGQKKGDAKDYSRTFLVLKAIKLFLTLAGVIFYVFFNKEMALPFLVTIVVYYVIYIVFEAIALAKLK